MLRLKETRGESARDSVFRESKGFAVCFQVSGLESRVSERWGFL